MNKEEKQKMFEGDEMWTNVLGKRFGERVCVGFEYPYLWCDGQKFKPTKKEINDLWEEYWSEGDGGYLLEDAKLGGGSK